MHFIRGAVAGGILLAVGGQGEANVWHEAPFRIQAGGKYLDTSPADSGGHAAPYLADLDGDRKRDLIVGSIQGKFRFFRNLGTDSAPRFAEEPAWLMAGDKAGEGIARVPNYCCVAAGPQVLDIDGDGILDLSSGSYDPGAIYWFKGLGGVNFAVRQMLTNTYGVPLFTHIESIDSQRHKSFVSNIAWMDWNSDGILDLLIGSGKGELFLRIGGEGASEAIPPPTERQPIFYDAYTQRYVARCPGEILIDGGRVVPDGHAAPAVADWDGDGLQDILLGSYSGSVYLLRNGGKPGAPEFKLREQIVDPGMAAQWIEADEIPRRGRRSQVTTVDYNLDGKMDLLLGDWFLTSSPRADLMKKERKQMLAIRGQLDGLDKQADFKYDGYRSKTYPEALRGKAQELEKQLAPYLQQYRWEGWEETTTQHPHGTVWVFLRK